jgi:hypothetical protein
MKDSRMPHKDMMMLELASLNYEVSEYEEAIEMAYKSRQMSSNHSILACSYLCEIICLIEMAQLQ